MPIVSVEFRSRRSWDGLNAYTVAFADGKTRVVDAYDELEAWQLATNSSNSDDQKTGTR